MQEPSVSSTTSSPCKLTNNSTENSTKDPTVQLSTDPQVMSENNEDSVCNQNFTSDVKSSTHSKRRTHTCSKAHKRCSKSEDRRSRRSRNKRRHHRNRRSRSRSRHYSGSRHQHRRRRRRRYSSTTSSSSSDRNYSECRSPSYRPQRRRHNSNSSQRTVIHISRSDYDSGESNYKSSPQRFRASKKESQPNTSVEQPNDPMNSSILARSLPQLSVSNSALNGIVSLLLNNSSSANSLTDVLGSAINGITGGGSGANAPPQTPNNNRQARRLYIGSIPIGITSETMVAFFNSELQSRGLCQAAGDPVVNAQVNSERHFAFIELRTVDETTAALTLDGINCLGSTLRIRRPRDYFPPGTSSGNPGGHLNPNAILLTGIPSNLPEQALARLLSAYGTLRSFSILRDPVTAMSRGCGFFEYATSRSADLACVGLANHPAGGGKFFAIRADHLLVAPPPTPLSSLAVPASNPPSSPLATIAAQTATTVLCLANMVSPRDIDSPEDYADVREDVRSECLRHGTVINIHIPQPKATSAPAAGGKIFVEFASAQQAKAASLALEGRMYNGRKVTTSFCDPVRYATGEYYGGG